VAHFAKLVVVVASGCVLGLLGVGCSPSNSGGVDAAPVPLAQLPEQYADVICDTVGPCCRSAGIAYDSNTCKSAAKALFQGFVQMSNTPGTTYDAAAAGRCKAAVQTALQSCTNFDDGTTGVACAYIFVGSVPLGGACQQDSDCADHGGCGLDPNSPDGTSMVCVAALGEQAHAQAGAACNGDCIQSTDGDIECTSGGIAGGGSAGGGSGGGGSATPGICYASDGLFCGTQTQVCTPFAKIGEACEDQGCVAGAFCDLGKCTAQLDSGPCTSSSGACSAKSFCDDASQQCVPRLADGASCEFSSQCSSDECSETADPNKRVCGAPTAATPKLCSGQLN
jgi:hypothetical protein